jgi:Uma2 family endonuclease
VSTLFDQDGLAATWRQINTDVECSVRGCSELDGSGEVVPRPPPSPRRQIVTTDIFCQLAEQIGHVAAMSTPVTTHTFGIRVPDVVWMPPEKWEGFEREGPVPFVPDLCVEVLLDQSVTRDVESMIRAYIESGAREVIVVDSIGQVRFFGANGQRAESIYGITLSLDQMYFDAADRLPAGPFQDSCSKKILSR